jgi:flavodoxin I
MNSLVIYDSQFGNTEKIARHIAETLREFGEARAERVDNAHALTLKGIDLLVIGGPTQGWRATPAIKNFIAHLKLDDLDRVFAAEFDTRFDKPRWLTGSAARGIDKQLKQLGLTVLVPPESFFVKATEGPLEEGELEHAARWARTLHDEYARQAKFVAAMA